MTPFDCPNCKGKGEAFCVCGGTLPGHGYKWCARPIPCQSCGGSGIDPELVEVGAKALAEYRGDPVYSECSKPWSSHDEEAAQSVLAAVVAYWKEKE